MLFLHAINFFLFIHFVFNSSTLKDDDKLNESSDDVYFEAISPQDIRYSYRTRLAKDFGSNFNKKHSNIRLVPVQPIDGCIQIVNKNELYNQVALVERGKCSFLTKVINAESHGAVAVIVMDFDNENDAIVEMIRDDTQRDTQIPALFLPWKDGFMIRNSIDKSKQKSAIINIPLNMTFRSVHELKRAPWSSW